MQEKISNSHADETLSSMLRLFVIFEWRGIGEGKVCIKTDSEENETIQPWQLCGLASRIARTGHRTEKPDSLSRRLWHGCLWVRRGLCLLDNQDSHFSMSTRAVEGTKLGGRPPINIGDQTRDAPPKEVLTRSQRDRYIHVPGSLI